MHAAQAHDDGPLQGERPAHGPHGVNESALLRMRSIEGQVKGIGRMIEDERYCVDIVDQISAVRAALAKVSEEVLRRHIETCVADEFRSGSPGEQARVIDELVDIIARRLR